MPTTTDTNPGTTPPGALRTEDLGTKTSNGNGLATFNVVIDKGDTAFLFDGVADSGLYASIEKVEDPDGKVILDWTDWAGANSLTGAFTVSDRDVPFNFPIRAAEGKLAKGTYKVYVATTTLKGQYQSGVDVAGSVVIKQDDDLTQGGVKVRIVYCKGIDDDAGIVTAVEAAVEHWKEVWAGAGLTLEPTYESSNVDPAMSYPTYGASKVADLAAEDDDSTLMMLIGDDVEGSNQIYGIAGGIPGSLQATGRAVVEVSWIVHAGTNGVFNDNEIQVMGETMAHESGHFVGLFHPVEGTWNLWDAIDDTPECTSNSTCQTKLGENLMYPYSICDRNGCDSQYILTDGQAEVMNRYTGVYLP